jgi:hypothetical protein
VSSSEIRLFEHGLFVWGIHIPGPW